MEQAAKRDLPPGDVGVVLAIAADHHQLCAPLGMNILRRWSIPGQFQSQPVGVRQKDAQRISEILDRGRGESSGGIALQDVFERLLRRRTEREVV
ncbi:hypothetical protein ABOZ73_02070 [Caulobacter sp. 73W]|uniref:Uncharacterized protein n=1 Tax=Caulobacter sp. 73W TaxID=3161137 RepID=A0AB39KUJ3_9CAUL